MGASSKYTGWSPEMDEKNAPTFVFGLGPGGDLAVVSEAEAPPQPSVPVIPQHAAPQFVQSIPVSSEIPSPSPLTSQPLPTTTPSLSRATRVATSIVDVTSSAPVVSSSLIASTRSGKGSSVLATTSISTSLFTSASTTVYVSTTTASASISTSTSASLTPSSTLVSTSSSYLSSSSLLSSSSYLPSSSSSLSSAVSSSSSPSSLASISSTTSSSPSPSSTDTTSSEIVPASATPTSVSSQTPSPTSAAISSSDARHHPPFYVGIILGTILVIACLAAFIAWVVRLRMHARRHRSASAPDVPWANASHESVLEEGRDATFIGHPVSGRGSLDISSQDIVPGWEPRGDRDVGEPKRSKSYLNPSIRSESASDPFGDRPKYPVLAESVAYPLPLYHGSYPTVESSQLPASNSDGSLDGYRSASTLGPLQIANMAPGDASVASSRAPTALGMNDPAGDYGTPRENQVGFRPRFLGLEGGGLRVPWSPPPAPRRTSFAARRRGGSGTWEHLPPLPMPGETLGAEPVAENGKGDGWTSSLKSSLASAFNAVAATLPSAPMMHEKDDSNDNLTPTPSRLATNHTSTRERGRPNISNRDFFEQPISRNESIVSRPWSLEDRGDGTGMVRFHGQGLDDYGGNYGHSPQLLGSSVTLSSGVHSTPGTSITRMSTRESQTPLIASGKTKSAYLRPNTYTRPGMPQDGQNMRLETGSGVAVSRNSSVYSMASATSSVGRTAEPLPPRIPVLQRQSTMKISTLRPDEKKDGMAHERPVSVSRLSSSGCSFTSYYYGSEGAEASGGDMTEGEEAVHKAITDRRKRLRRVA
ncbi:hypothetical protein Hypma_001207 [Hypsizygus marmoreus]|uniref:Uncharacterized protein n=1 Tax=Hypsizygus marmoreus TaxID=39966 RepID=A0A369J6E4_HYPMA|nr:hypothetical protein Hypma_001207 [Hypsizygus marmoreus]